jgi:hypothetical protein
MNLDIYVSLVAESETTLADSFRQVAEAHRDEPDIHFLCHTLATQCDARRARLQPVIDRFEKRPADDEPERLNAQGLGAPRRGPLGMLRDLQDLYLLASLVDITWTMIDEAARALIDPHLIEIVTVCQKQTAVQLRWLQTRMKQAAPHALIAAQ